MGDYKAYINLHSWLSLQLIYLHDLSHSSFSALTLSLLLQSFPAQSQLIFESFNKIREVKNLTGHLISIIFFLDEKSEGNNG